jgi:hypothetical protein
MSHCKQATITDAAFVHLRGIHMLTLHGCIQQAITPAVFTHLRGTYYMHARDCHPAVESAAEAFNSASIASHYEAAALARARRAAS